MNMFNIRKILTYGFIILILSLSVSPVFAFDNKQQNHSSSSIKNKMIPIVVSEFKFDGTIEKKTMIISAQKLEEFRGELRSHNGEDERLRLYKEYGLIPHDVTIEYLKIGMEKKIRSMNLNKTNLEEISEIIDSRNTLQPGRNGWRSDRNIMCFVTGDFMVGVKFLLGLSFVTSVINAAKTLYYDMGFIDNYTYSPSIDLVQLHLSTMITLSTSKGLLPNFYANGMYARTIMIGFVGYYVSYAPRFFLEFGGEFIGYAAYVRCSWSDYYAH